MAWITIAKSVVTGFTGWAYENTATAANTYSEANGSYSGGIRTFNPPGPTPAQETYVRCRRLLDNVERGELSKTYYDARP
tara:strand:+ start:356 stop:595 length:240 start_codon:yes stop_codon:yes gene_type:complete